MNDAFAGVLAAGLSQTQNSLAALTTSFQATEGFAKSFRDVLQNLPAAALNKVVDQVAEFKKQLADVAPSLQAAFKEEQIKRVTDQITITQNALKAFPRDLTIQGNLAYLQSLKAELQQVGSVASKMQAAFAGLNTAFAGLNTALAAGASLFGQISSSLERVVQMADPQGFVLYQAAWDRLSIEIGSIFIPIMREVTSLIASVAAWLNSLDDSTRETIASWAKWVIGITAVAAVLVVLIGVIKSLAIALWALAVNPVVLALLAIAAAAALIASSFGAAERSAEAFRTQVRQMADDERALASGAALTREQYERLIPLEARRRIEAHPAGSPERQAAIDDYARQAQAAQEAAGSEQDIAAFRLRAEQRLQELQGQGWLRNREGNRQQAVLTEAGFSRQEANAIRSGMPVQPRNAEQRAALGIMTANLQGENANIPAALGTLGTARQVAGARGQAAQALQTQGVPEAGRSQFAGQSRQRPQLTSLTGAWERAIQAIFPSAEQLQQQYLIDRLGRNADVTERQTTATEANTAALRNRGQPGWQPGT